MILNINEKILSYENSPLVLDKEEVTWKTIIYQALNSVDREEKNSVEDKMKCYQLTLKTFSSDSPDYSVEECTFILQKIKKIGQPIICGRAEEFFNRQNESK